jgi:hypothetical protein
MIQRRARTIVAGALIGAGLLLPACSRRGEEFPPAFVVPPSEMKPSGYRVQWESFRFPRRVARASKVYARVRFGNAGSEVWHGSVHCARYFVPSGAPLSAGRDPAPRLLLKRPVAPGQSVTLERFPVETPDQSGDYVLVFDLVNEEVAWFSDRGARRLVIPVRVD